MRHKLLAGIIPFCSGKRKPSTFTPSSLMDCNHIATNNNMLHSKSTYFYRWSSRYTSIAPIACALTLLVGIGLLLNPTTKVQQVYAAENKNECKTTSDEYGICAMELGIFMNGTDSSFNELPATELSVDNVVHRDYNFSVRAVDTKDGYNLYAGVVNTGSFGNSLVNADYPTEDYMIKALTGTDVAYSSIGNNEWGYALTATNQNAEELSYNSLPVATITTENDKTTLTNGKLLVHGEDTGYDPSQPVGEDRHTDQDYKLYFAAKASPESPSGHYRTQVMLSLVASPKSIAKTMQKFAELGTCASLKESTMADDNQIQLIDRRTINGTIVDKAYWIAKLKDGKCWMTQNLDLPLSTTSVLTSNDTDLPNGTATYQTTNLENYQDPGKYAYSIEQANLALPSSNTNCGNPSDASCSTFFQILDNNMENNKQAHYLVGNYYPPEITTTGKNSSSYTDGSICPKGWKLPSESEYTNLISGLNKDTIRRPPYYYIPAGIYYSKAYSGVGGTGTYWVLKADNYGNIYRFNFDSSVFQVGNYSSIGYNGGPVGRSLRCIVK